MPNQELTPEQKEELKKEWIRRQFEKKREQERGSLKAFIKSYWKLEKKEELVDNWHIDAICHQLERVARGEVKRLIINIPPRNLKTEIVTKAFPIWLMGNDPSKKFMSISYSSELAQKNSGSARDMYLSSTYRRMFPRRPELKDDQNTKQHWENEAGGHYYATGSGGTITGIGADVILIDDPIKPDEADSQVVRQGVNNNYHDTIRSRLNNPAEGAIVIIMQRLHDDDLCGHLMELELLGTGEKREKLIIPAIAEGDDEYRKKGESFFPSRYPIEMLHKMKTERPVYFSTQYQQNPVDKDSQEFHEGRIRRYDEMPSGGRIFTTVDPAFKQGMENDNSCIMTGKFVGEKMYILEYSVGKFTADVLQDKIIYHIRKRSPEKVGIEAYQAQSMILTFLKQELQRLGIHVNIEEIKQTGDKLSKIRKLIPLYRDGLIYHKRDMDELEAELKRFPRGKHDDIIDAEQMLYDLYTLQPNSVQQQAINIQYDQRGQPFMA